MDDDCPEVVLLVRDRPDHVRLARTLQRLVVIHHPSSMSLRLHCSQPFAGAACQTSDARTNGEAFERAWDG
jgi:hypothetical protein